MKIVVLDGYTENPGDLSWDGLKEYGDVTVYDRTLGGVSEIIERIGDAEVVYTNKVPITSEILGTCPNIKFIGVLATGYNVVDIAGAKEKGIPVCNIPAYGTEAVAQFTIALLLEVCHHIGRHSDAVEDGAWSDCPDFCFWETPLIELTGKNIGIIGFGKIGKAVARIAEALGMNVLAYSAELDMSIESESCRSVDLDTLIKESDVISLHCPLFPETEGMINGDTISRMKDGVILLNSSRGPLIVEEDLAEALYSGKVMAAGVDVVSVEPIRQDNPLLHAPNCIITPHIAWATKESRQRLMNIAVENLAQFLKGTPQNVVN